MAVIGNDVSASSPHTAFPQHQRAYLATPLALMRLLARVHTAMDGERGPLDELLSAAGKVAHVRTNARMNPLCSKKRHCQLAAPSLFDQGRRDEPWRARSLRLAKPLPQVEQGYAFGGCPLAMGILVYWMPGGMVMLVARFAGRLGRIIPPLGVLGSCIWSDECMADGEPNGLPASKPFRDGGGAEKRECSEPWGEPVRSRGCWDNGCKDWCMPGRVTGGR